MKLTWNQLLEWLFIAVVTGYVVYLSVEAFQVSQPTIHEAVKQILAN